MSMMLWPPESLAAVFSARERESYADRCLAYAFVLATPLDEAAFTTMIRNIAEIDSLTADVLCVFFATDPDRQLERAAERGDLARCRSEAGQVLLPDDVSPVVRGFVQRHSAETYAFSRYIGLGEDELPCIVVFDSLDHPATFAYLSLKGSAATDVLGDFRSVTRAVREAKAHRTTAVQAVGALQNRRWALRSLGKGLNLATTLKNLKFW